VHVLYRHTQFGYVIVTGLGSGVVGISAAIVTGHAPHALFGAVAVLCVCLALFPTLTTVVDPRRVQCFFGVGIIRREIELRDVVSVSVVRNSWSYGWGLRLIPGGRMWNVSGLDAVELRLRDGMLIRIGTDEPTELQRAITNALATG
jgi:hypothetical protein